MKTMNKLAAVALTLCAATTANAGKGGSAAKISKPLSPRARPTRSSPRSNARRA